MVSSSTVEEFYTQGFVSVDALLMKGLTEELSLLPCKVDQFPYAQVAQAQAGEADAVVKLTEVLSDWFEEVYLGSCWVFNKPPRSKRMYWHDDFLFWDQEKLLHRKFVGVILAYYPLVSTNMGCLEVLPNSHHDARYHREIYGDDSGNLSQLIKAIRRGEGGKEHKALAPHPHGVRLEGVDLAVVLDPRLLHCSGANLSASHRVCLSFHFFPKALRALFPLNRRSFSRISSR